MNSRIPGFRGEYLWELDIAQRQLTALGEAFPAELYGWRPAQDARSFSEVLVHVATGNFLLLRVAGVPAPAGFDIYGPHQGDRFTKFTALIRENLSMEKTVIEKRSVIDLLSRSFEAIRHSMVESSDEEIETTGEFFGEQTTVRRVYLRMLAHTHEHMGQAVAYARINGIRVPWADPLKELDRMTAEASSR